MRNEERRRKNVEAMRFRNHCCGVRDMRPPYIPRGSAPLPLWSDAVASCEARQVCNSEQEKEGESGRGPEKISEGEAKEWEGGHRGRMDGEERLECGEWGVDRAEREREIGMDTASGPYDNACFMCGWWM